MIITWMLYALLVSALVAAAAGGVEALLRVLAIPARWVWAGALLLCIALAGIAPARMAPPPGGFPEARLVTSLTSARPATERSAPGLATRVLAAEAEAVRRLRVGLAEAGSRVPSGSGVALVLLWCAASLVALSVIGATHRRAVRERRRWPTSEVQGLRVRVAPSVGPAVIGVARPEIVVPRWFFRLAPEQTRLVLAHESEHIRAGDPMLLTLGWTVAALLPWNPAVLWMVARLRLAIEVDCDARVLGRGADPRSYGSVLIDLAGRPSRLGVGMLALADPPSQLERRLLAMSFQRTRSALARAVALGALSAIVLSAACAAELPTAADIQDLTVVDAENAAREASLIGDANTVYMLDGVVVTPGVARSVAPHRIAGVGVQRAETPGDPSRVTIVTHEGAANGLVAKAIAVPGVLIEELPEGSPLAAKVTVRGNSAVGAPMPADQSSAAVSVRVRSGVEAQSGAVPVLFIDGLRKPYDARTSPFGSVGPDDIESVSVVKDRELGVRLAGPDGANGVIVIRTKNGPDDGFDLGETANAPLRVRATSPATIVRTPSGGSPAYFIDGVRASEGEFRALDPQRIESVNVIKDPTAAARLAGPDGSNGVVEIKTRRAAQ